MTFSLLMEELHLNRVIEKLILRYYITRALSLSRGSSQWGRITVTRLKRSKDSNEPNFIEFGP